MVIPSRETDPWLAELAADGFGDWLAGFVDGEGSFLIERKRPKDGLTAYCCCFRLQLRSDDREILQVIHHRTALGRVWDRPDRQHQQCGSRPASYWAVTRKSEVGLLVRLFERFPMRAKKGAVDFPIWKHAVNLWLAGPTYRRAWEDMAVLKEQLAAARRFDPRSIGTAMARDDVATHLVSAAGARRTRRAPSG